jgi:hypothetical protein
MSTPILQTNPQHLLVGGFLLLFFQGLQPEI